MRVSENPYLEYFILCISKKYFGHYLVSKLWDSGWFKVRWIKFPVMFWTQSVFVKFTEQNISKTLIIFLMIPSNLQNTPANYFCLWAADNLERHYVKSVHIRSYSGPNAGNTDQNNSGYAVGIFKVIRTFSVLLSDGIFITTLYQHTENIT